MSNFILETRNLTKEFKGFTAVNDVNLKVQRGHIHALIGPNGAGKTTLVSEIAGEVRPDAGQILFACTDITNLPVHRRTRAGLGRSFQITSVFSAFTTLENVTLALQAAFGPSFRLVPSLKADRARVAEARDLLALTGLEAKAGVPASDLSHGEKRALELAMALA
eukprot:gene53607-biopygen7612